jgi:hypothetical protein
MRPLPLAAAGTSARLWFYPPRLRQAAHSHERAHVSILIGGSIREVCGGRDEIGVGSQLRLRPYEIRHEVEFGPEGALILAVEVSISWRARPPAAGFIATFRSRNACCSNG